MIFTVFVSKEDIVRPHAFHFEVAVGEIVATGLFVLGISQPPRAPVRRLPRALFLDITVHGMVAAPTTTIGSASNIH